MRHLPFAAESFGGVWSSAAMLHLPKSDLPQTLAETHRVLDHGQLYLAVKEGQAETWEGDPAHGQRFFAYYQPAEVELALERADFHVLWQMLSPDQRGYNWINMIVWKKLPKVAAAANALIFNEQAQILLTRRADNGWWCIPGGHLDPNETIEAAAVREALEETGLTVTIEQVTGMYNVTYPAALMPEKKPRHIFVIAYRCRVLSGSLTLNDEVTEFGWFAPEHLPTDMMPHHAARVQDAIKKQ
jgi:8-oxo-dGTP pyrophosphatase MutT (NUDIX family)